MPEKQVLFLKKDHLAYITLNRPETGNYLDLAMAQDLAEVCRKIDQDKDIHVVILTGTGGVFCRGGNEKELLNPGEKEQFSSLFSPSKSIDQIDCPTIAALNGDTLGMGLELALACDLRVTADTAKLGLPQITEGYIPGDGGTQRLSRIVGRTYALEMILSGETIGSQEALEIGLVNRIVSSGSLASEVENLAKTIASKAPIAARYAKLAVNQGLDLTLDQGLRFEADLYFLLHTTSDRTEGIQSFLNKRAPHYKGE
jgi:enoyl-CoA hydratase/carnithine racemase